MNKPLQLSRYSLVTFLICRRRFQLQFLDHLAWPDSVPDPKQSASFELGQNFHLLLERFFSGLPVEEEFIPEHQLRKWWRRFQEDGPELPLGQRLPELRLTVPAGAHYLTGRFDLLVIDHSQQRPKAHIFDWKTSRPHQLSELETDWQTRLYLAMIAESGRALIQDGPALSPDDVTLTYWFTSDPANPQRIIYSQNQHDQNWAEILNIISDIDACLEENAWPLTANWTHCRYCPYQAYCGRWEAGKEEIILLEEPADYGFDLNYLIEPEIP